MLDFYLQGFSSFFLGLQSMEYAHLGSSGKIFQES